MQVAVAVALYSTAVMADIDLTVVCPALTLHSTEYATLYTLLFTHFIHFIHSTSICTIYHIHTGLMQSMVSQSFKCFGAAFPHTC